MQNSKADMFICHNCKFWAFFVPETYTWMILLDMILISSITLAFSACVRLCINVPSPSLNQLRRRWETGGWWDWGRGSFPHWRRTRDQERTEPANITHVCIYTGAAHTNHSHTHTHTNTGKEGDSLMHSDEIRLIRQITWNQGECFMLLAKWAHRGKVTNGRIISSNWMLCPLHFLVRIFRLTLQECILFTALLLNIFLCIIDEAMCFLHIILFTV